MDSKRMVTGIAVGGVVLFATGYVIFELLLGDFYDANAGAATGVAREDMIYWAGLLGSFTYAALIAYAARGEGSGLTVTRGAWVGGIVGCLLWATTDFTFYSFANLSNLTLTIVDPLVEFIHGGIGGAVIAALLRRAPA